MDGSSAASGRYGTGDFPEILENLVVPDGNVIVSVHVYLPYNFCQNEEGSDEWSLKNPDDTQEIEAVFGNLKRLFVEKGIPVILTEFGCTDKDNLDDRIEWTAFYINKANENDVSCIWWDNGSNFQLLGRETNQWIYKDLVDVLFRYK
jgi:endoglucanase